MLGSNTLGSYADLARLNTYGYSRVSTGVSRVQMVLVLIIAPLHKYPKSRLATRDAKQMQQSLLTHG